MAKNVISKQDYHALVKYFPSNILNHNGSNRNLLDLEADSLVIALFCCRTFLILYILFAFSTTTNLGSDQQSNRTTIRMAKLIRNHISNQVISFNHSHFYRFNQLKSRQNGQQLSQRRVHHLNQRQIQVNTLLSVRFYVSSIIKIIYSSFTYCCFMYMARRHTS